MTYEEYRAGIIANYPAHRVWLAPKNQPCLFFIREDGRTYFARRGDNGSPEERYVDTVEPDKLDKWAGR